MFRRGTKGRRWRGVRRALVEARKSLGLTQADLARRVGLTRAAYSNIECGTKNPSLETALRIAAALGRSVEELFGCPKPPGGSRCTVFPNPEPHKPRSRGGDRGQRHAFRASDPPFANS
ncbi:MAG: helix-turn-helix transcriptional regulator [Thermoleophilia bacterium]|nr:helix-turn-helix transcriptional regulator [Thermoleophilia bacterium]